MDFPRGGKRTSSSVQESSNKEKDLFKTEDVEPQAKKPKIGKSKRHTMKKQQRFKIIKTSEPLNFEMLTEDFMVLGVVKEVKDHTVIVSLPVGLVGSITLTSVSQPYTQLLKKIADDESANEEIPTLKDLFQVGDALPCRIVRKTKKGFKRLLDLSVDPRVVNQDLPITALKSGCLLFGAVASVEEHGYILDVGIPGIKAFLQSFSKDDTRLQVGQCLWCCVQSEAGLELITGESRVIKVSANVADVNQAEVQTISSIESIRPGMKITATVEKITKETFRLRCYQYKGCIFRSHLPDNLTKFTSNQQVQARVLYTHPVSKVIYLSLLPGVVDLFKKTDRQWERWSVGDIIESAQVVYVDKARGVYFKMENFRALASNFHLSDNKIDMDHSFPRGSRHRCRVIGFHPVDDVILVSLKQSILQEKFMTLKDIIPGQNVECQVCQIIPCGVIVSLSKKITALIPNLHVAEVPIKHVEKKFTKGDKLKCKVLKVDETHNKIILSHKKSLVNTSRLVPISYEELQPDMQLEGYLISIKDAGVLVGFCNDVKGWVPRSELSTTEISHPETVFYPGQVVRSRVISCHPASQKLRLSLVISGKTPLAGKKQHMADFEVGKLLEAKVIKKLETTLEVELMPSGVKATLPKVHLSDFPENQELLWRAIGLGTTLPSIMLYKQTSSIIVTLKESFLKAARDGQCIKTFSDLEPGQLLPGVIKNHQNYGIFVDLAGGLTGLAPLKFTMDRPTNDLESIFVRGQSVVVKVMEVREENQRFLCSMRLCDCFQEDPEVGMDLLDTYLRERSLYTHILLDQKAKKLKAGSLVMIEVTKSTDKGYLCQTDWGLQGLITRHHSGLADLQVGSKQEAVVLDVDPLTPSLELSINKDLIRIVSRRSSKKTMDQARVGQRIKAELLCVNKQLMLFVLKQHAVGTLAYVPLKQHLNDVVCKVPFSVGDVTGLVMIKVDSVPVQANLDSRIPEVTAKKGKLLLTPWHDYHLGQIVTAQIEAIHPVQMNIKIGNVHGRLHVTELQDVVQHGKYAFGGYKKNQTLEVKIIGFRHFKSMKYLPISHPRIHKAMPECTTKASKLEMADCPEEIQASYKRWYQPGEKINVFAVKFQTNKLWVNVSPVQSGVISVFDLSRDLGQLQHAEKNFPAGYGYLATVIKVEEEGLIHLSLTGKKEEVKRHKFVTGKVSSISSNGVFLRLPDGFRGRIPLQGDESEKQIISSLSVGLFMRCWVVSCKDKNGVILSLHQTERAEKSSSPSKISEESKAHSSSGIKLSEDNEKMSRKRKRSKDSTDTKTVSEELKPLKVANRLPLEEGFCWVESRKSDAPGSNLSDDEEDNEIAPKKKMSKKSLEVPSQMSHPVKGEVKDFDRLLLANPNDSMLWIEYMAHHLNAGDIDKARAVAENALKTISFREEQSKVNVWFALLNLENQYGSKEQVQETFARALKVNDPLTIYLRLAAMYISSGKMEEAGQTYQLMVKKFRQTMQVWVDYGRYLYNQGQLQTARNLLQRSLLSLQRSDHVDIITKFAVMEFSHGEAERGATLFEQVLTEFPRRTDVLSIYIDACVKAGDLDQARELLERAIVGKKNKPFFLKKYLTLEEKYGTAEGLEKIKARIAEETG